MPLTAVVKAATDVPVSPNTLTVRRWPVVLPAMQHRYESNAGVMNSKISIAIAELGLPELIDVYVQLAFGMGGLRFLNWPAAAAPARRKVAESSADPR